MRRTLRALCLATALPLLATLALFGTGACGGAPAQPPGSVRITMSDFKFDPKDLTVKSGKVTFFAVNSAMDGHDVVIEDASGHVAGRSPMLSASEAAAFTIDNLAPGTYTYYCDVPGHRAAGMVGTLTVN